MQKTLLLNVALLERCTQVSYSEFMVRKHLFLGFVTHVDIIDGF